MTEAGVETPDPTDRLRPRPGGDETAVRDLPTTLTRAQVDSAILHYLKTGEVRRGMESALAEYVRQINAVGPRVRIAPMTAEERAKLEDELDKVLNRDFAYEDAGEPGI